ncbi:MAG: sialidase family protein [Planctomycetia bacterium]
MSALPAGARCEVEERGLIHDTATAPAERRVAFFTSLAALTNGDVLAGFQVGPDKHAATSTIGLARSHDAGRTWTAIDWRFPAVLDGVPGSLAVAEMVEPEPGRLMLFASWFDRSDPRRPLFDPATSGILPARVLVAESGDGGGTWSDWRTLSTSGLRGSTLTGPVLRWSDGTLAVPFESYRECDEPEPRHHSAWLMTSRDGGRSFDEPLCVARHPEDRVYYWDQRLCAGPRPGEFTALFWTHDLVDQRDLTVHLRRCRLDGAGIAGDAPSALPITGQIAAPLALPDGRLLAFVVDRSRPSTMTLWSSPDGGTSWPATDRLTVYAHDETAALSQGTAGVNFAAYWEDMGKWTFGHPALLPLADCRVLAAWYAGVPGAMSIHSARIRVR